MLMWRAALAMRARSGRFHARERLLAAQEQLDALNRLDDRAWHYVNTLSQTRERGRDTALIRREYEAQIDAEQAHFESSLRQEQELGTTRELAPREEEQQQFQQVLLRTRHWAQRAEARIRAEPERVPVAPAVLWELYQDYKEGVGEYITSIHAEEQEERVQMRSRWNGIVERSMSVARIITIGCSALLVVMALALLLPLRGALRELRTAADRIGRGNFEQLLFADRLAAVGRVAAGVGHEINNPLSYIISNLRFIPRAGRRGGD